MNLTHERIHEVLDRAATKRILVVGDCMLDRYIQGTVDRISPEAPVPVVHVRSERSVPGGACNVGLNIQSLGAQACMCGIVGTSSLGDELLSCLSDAGVEIEGIHRDPRATTIVKTRVLADRQQVVRVDREANDHEAVANSPGFLEHLRVTVAEVDGVILEDYGKGWLTQACVEVVQSVAKEKGILVGYDPKDDHHLEVRGITFATPNHKEAFHAAQMGIGPGDRCHPLEDESLAKAASILFERWEPEMLMITLGPDGMFVQQKGADAHHVPTRAREVFDVSGAGDTVIATMMLALLGGASAEDAAELANLAGGVVVAKLGTATCTREEICAALDLLQLEEKER